MNRSNFLTCAVTWQCCIAKFLSLQAELEQINLEMNVGLLLLRRPTKKFLLLKCGSSIFIFMRLTLFIASFNKATYY